MNIKQLKIKHCIKKSKLSVPSLNSISSNNWNIDYPVNAQFTITHDNHFINLNFEVKEQFIKASHQKINQPVYEDSCVEFFLSFDELNYYNFEFNCIGNILVGYGASRNDRKLLPEEIINQISRKPSCGYEPIILPNKFNDWNLKVSIPCSVFIFDEILSLNNRKAKGNFYKCGDNLPIPHFLSWSPIKTIQPDFHRPEYFGDLFFT